MCRMIKVPPFEQTADNIRCHYTFDGRAGGKWEHRKEYNIQC